MQKASARIFFIGDKKHFGVLNINEFSLNFDRPKKL